MKSLSSISLQEQKNLLERIQTSLSLYESLESRIVQVPSEPQSRIQLLQKEWSKAPVGHKLNHWAKNLVSIKTEAEFLLEAKLSEIRSALRSYPKQYTDFSRRVFLPDLAQEIYSVYKLLQPIRRPLERLVKDLEVLQKLFRQFIERNLQKSKASLVDFLSVEEMKQIFFQTEDKQQLMQEIQNRLQAYFESHPVEEFSPLQSALMPFYGIWNLSTFAFDEVFRVFQGNDSSEEQAPQFKEAPIYPTLEHIEQFFCALYPLRTYSSPLSFPKEILQYLVAFSEEGETLPHIQDIDPGKVEVYYKHLASLVAQAQKVFKEVPFVELIRYYRADPYFRIIIYQPKIQLRDFYIASLTLKVFSDFDAFFSKIRFDILEDLIRELFGNTPLQEFQYYMNTRLNLIPKQGYPGFTHYRSLVVLNNFILRVYKGNIQDTLHMLNRSISNRVRESISGMLIHASGIEEVENRLAKFDASFAPDAEAGKVISIVKLVLDKDPKQQKLYRTTIAEKDKEGKAILEKALTHLEALLLGLQTVYKDRVFLKETSKRYPTIESKISFSIKGLLYGTKALRYLAAMEKGAL
ncbi:MAG: DUF5312 family protein [Spirochaetales bacterium]